MPGVAPEIFTWSGSGDSTGNGSVDFCLEWLREFFMGVAPGILVNNGLRRGMGEAHTTLGGGRSQIGRFVSPAKENGMRSVGGGEAMPQVLGHFLGILAQRHCCFLVP